MPGADLLRVTGLRKEFALRRGWLGGTDGVLKAVDGVDLGIAEGETLGLVGESGSGKTTLARCVLRLIEPTGGSIVFEGVDFLALSPRRLRRARRHMQIIFQDPYGSLDPRMSIGSIVTEPLAVHRAVPRRARDQRVSELLEMVGLDPAARHRYPHEFSGGQRQRVGIARALALSPRLVVADEPVSALDVSVRAQVLNLMAELQERLGLAYLFIAHDLGVVRHISDRVAVMYLGRLVEVGPAAALYANPLHPYTRALLEAIPVPDPEIRRVRLPLAGEAPSLLGLPPGCRFQSRCPLVEERCRREDPALEDHGEGRFSACFRVERTPDGPRLP